MGRNRDDERRQRIRHALRKHRIDACICALPSNVLLLSGYWPKIANAVVVATQEATALIVPEDERRLTRESWADEIETFQPGGLNKLITADEALAAPLRRISKKLGIRGHRRIAYEAGPFSEPVTYAAMNIYGESLRRRIEVLFPAVAVVAGAP